MAAKVQQINGAGWVVVHHEGRKRRKRIGPAMADKREAERLAKVIQARIVLGQSLPVEPDRHSIPFSAFADDWYRREILKPYERREVEALAAKSVRTREQHIRLYLKPFFGDKDVRSVRVADVQEFYEKCRDAGRPRALPSLYTILGTLRRILANAEAKELLKGNPVTAWKAGRGRQRGGGLQPVNSRKVLTAEDPGPRRRPPGRASTWRPRGSWSDLLKIPYYTTVDLALARLAREKISQGAGSAAGTAAGSDSV